MKDIVERLRLIDLNAQRANAVCRDAATEITALRDELAKVRAERDAFEQCCEDWQNDALEACGVAVRLQALLDEAVKVIEPFAGRAFAYRDEADEWFCNPSVQVRHLRDASMLLHKIRGAK